MAQIDPIQATVVRQNGPLPASNGRCSSFPAIRARRARRPTKIRGTPSANGRMGEWAFDRRETSAVLILGRYAARSPCVPRSVARKITTTHHEDGAWRTALPVVRRSAVETTEEEAPPYGHDNRRH